MTHPQITGEFETHLTVRAAGTVEEIGAVAAAAGMKLTHIVLAHGDAPSQPMLTRHSRGTLLETVSAAQAAARELKVQGLDVVRLKIETSAQNKHAPTSRMEAARLPAAWHFEHHVKVLLAPSADLASLTEIARRHHARVSRNALRRRPDGMEERFLTQRFFGMGRDHAESSLAGLVAYLLSDGFTILDKETEYVVFDTNAGLDSGWLDAP